MFYILGARSLIWNVKRRSMDTLKKLRYWVFTVSRAAGSSSLVLWLLDYLLRFRPSWMAGTADRLFGFGAFFHYLGNSYALFLVTCSVLGLWLACLMWLL